MDADRAGFELEKLHARESREVGKCFVAKDVTDEFEEPNFVRVVSQMVEVTGRPAFGAVVDAELLAIFVADGQCRTSDVEGWSSFPCVIEQALVGGETTAAH